MSLICTTAFDNFTDLYNVIDNFTDLYNVIDNITDLYNVIDTFTCAFFLVFNCLVYLMLSVPLKCL